MGFKLVVRLLAVGVVIVASSAVAQMYTVQSQSMAYAPISGGTTVTLQKRGAASVYDATDEGYFTLPLGFAFPYYGQNYTSVHIDSNGFLLFGPSNRCDGPPGGMDFDCNNGAGYPSTARTPHNVVAPWQLDAEAGMSGVIRYWASAGQMEIEYSNWACYFGPCSFTFKVTLTASGLFQVHYGAITGMLSDASAGFENATGSLGAPFFSCSTTVANCSQTNWLANTLFTIGTPVQPDIMVTAVNVANVVAGGTGNLTFDVTATFQNFGQMAATGPFAWRAYLSTDRVLSPGTDILVYTSAPTLSLSGAGTAGATAMATGSAGTVSPPVPGQYYVLVEADTTGVVVEASETNNVGSTLSYFTNGLDLVATAVSGPAMTGPGNAMTVNVKWFNQGTSAAGMVTYRVLLSTDTLFSANDFVLTSGVRSVSGGQTLDENLNFTVPMNVPGGDSYFLLQIDPNNAVTESSEANNLVASVAKVTVTLADLVNNASDFLQPSTMMPTLVGDFGQPALVSLSFANPGGAAANNFQVSVVLSTDMNLSLLSDTIVYQQNVVQTLPGGMAALNLAFTLPLNNAAMVPFQSGNYYVFTIVDSGDAVNESNEFNNTRVVTGAVFLRAPGFDGGSGTGGGAGGGGGSGGGAAGGTAGGSAGGTAGGSAGGTAGGSAGGTAGGSAGGAAGGSAGGAAGGTAGGAAGGSAGGAAGGSAGGAAGGSAGGAAGGSAGGTAGGAAGGSAGGAGGGLGTGGGTGGGEEMPKGCGCSSGSELPALFGLAFLLRFASLRRRRGRSPQSNG